MQRGDKSPCHRRRHPHPRLFPYPLRVTRVGWQSPPVDYAGFPPLSNFGQNEAGIQQRDRDPNVVRAAGPWSEPQLGGGGLKGYDSKILLLTCFEFVSTCPLTSPPKQQKTNKPEINPHIPNQPTNPSHKLLWTD
jgi:hypothetical protein